MAKEMTLQQKLKPIYTVVGFKNAIMDALVLKHREKKQENAGESRILLAEVYRALSAEQAGLFDTAIQELLNEQCISVRRDRRSGQMTSIYVDRLQGDLATAAAGLITRAAWEEALRADLIRLCAMSRVKSVRQLPAQVEAGNQPGVRTFLGKYKNGTREELDSAKEALGNLIRCADRVALNTVDTLERNFSIACGLGSKGFTAMKRTVLSILEGDPCFLEEDPEIKHEVNTALRRYHILQNPPVVGIRGTAILTFQNGDQLTLTAEKTPLYLTASYVADIKKVKTAKLYSVENLTTFNALPFDCSNGAVIYTEGFPASVVTDLMLRIVRDNQLEQSYHFGDLDAYGFKILKDIEKKIGVKVEPFMMGLEDYRAHKAMAIKMTESNRKALLEMMELEEYSAEDKALFQTLLEDHKTLEQESFSVQSFDEPCQMT